MGPKPKIQAMVPMGSGMRRCISAIGRHPTVMHGRMPDPFPLCMDACLTPSRFDGWRFGRC